MKRLYRSGEIELVDPVTPSVADAPDRIVRRAVLVHAGPAGAPVTFSSGDGPIAFDDARILAVVESQNDLDDKLTQHYVSRAKIPVGAFVPILDQHESDSMNRVIGRLTGRLSFERRSVPKVGDDVACAVAEITWLGVDTCDRVRDGRLFHLSIGIDEQTNTLTEVSAVIDPAAPGAMILKKGKVSAPFALKGVPVNKSKKRMSLAKKLASAHRDLKSLSAKLGQTKVSIDLAAAERDVQKRLSALIKAGKVWPAEAKKIDVKRLAKMSKEALDARFEAYEEREVQVLMGQRGTSAALEFSQVGEQLEKKQQKQLQAEIRGDFKRMGAKMKSTGEGETKVVPKRLQADPSEKKMEDGDESPNQIDLPGDQAQDLTGMQQQVDEIQTTLARVCGVVQDLVSEVKESDSSEEPEGSEAELEKDPEKKVEAALEEKADDKDDEKKLSDDEESEDDDEEDKNKE